MRAFFIVVVLVLVVGCGLAYWLNWWRIDTAPNTVQVTVDKDKMNEDVKAAQGTITEDVKDLKEGVHKKGEAQSHGLLVEGTIRAIDASNHKLTVMNDKKEEFAVKTDAATRIHVGDKEGTLADLKVGDSATVTYETAKGDKVAKSVTVKKRS